MRLSRTVLVVEDEPLILMAACDIVESAGFTVKDAVNADRALQILEMDSSISVLFTDIDMPGSMDGLSLAVKVHARWPHIGIIITSGRWPLGGVDKFEPVSGGSDMNHAEEAVGKLVVAGGDGAIDLEVAEHALNAVALHVERPVMFDFHAAV